jgi:hypothetical protein
VWLLLQKSYCHHHHCNQQPHASGLSTLKRVFLSVTAGSSFSISLSWEIAPEISTSGPHSEYRKQFRKCWWKRRRLVLLLRTCSQHDGGGEEKVCGIWLKIKNNKAPAGYVGWEPVTSLRLIDKVTV